MSDTKLRERAHDEGARVAPLNELSPDTTAGTSLDPPVERRWIAPSGSTIITNGDVKDECKIRVWLMLLGRPPVIPPDMLEEIRRDERQRKERERKGSE